MNNAGCYLTVAPTVGNSGTGVTGSPSTANCNEPTRLIQEGTLGYTYRLVNSPKYGRLQYQFLYSYLTRDSWTGLTSAAATFGTPAATFHPAHAENNMIFGGMRYYIPQGTFSEVPCLFCFDFSDGPRPVASGDIREGHLLKTLMPGLPPG